MDLWLMLQTLGLVKAGNGDPPGMGLQIVEIRKKCVR